MMIMTIEVIQIDELLAFFSFINVFTFINVKYMYHVAAGVLQKKN